MPHTLLISRSSVKVNLNRVKPSVLRFLWKRQAGTFAMNTNHIDDIPQPSKEELSTLSTQDLVARITSLEGQLRDQTRRMTEISLGAPRSFRTHKFKKQPGVFDASNYENRSIALKFSYLGQPYNGFEHANGAYYPLPTVEEVLWKALRKTRLISPAMAPGADGNLDVIWDTRDRDQIYATDRRSSVDEDSGTRLELNWEGCEYSKCGRTDKGVSAFGQVVGIRVRSSRPRRKKATRISNTAEMSEDLSNDEGHHDEPDQIWDDVRDELPYITLLNTVLPSSIRILAWAPHPPVGFDARFFCLERQYKYFFTNPAFCPTPGPAGLSIPNATRPDKPPIREGYLDIEAMQEAAGKLVGLHDYRNLCKLDASKQMPCCERRITHASITEFIPDPTLLTTHPHLQQHASNLSNGHHDGTSNHQSAVKVYTINIHGSAFLWHQVRCIAAILFLVGQRLEPPSVVDSLLDIESMPGRPHYKMADDAPLVLWNCVFPGDDPTLDAIYPERAGTNQVMEWIYPGDERILNALPPRSRTDGKFGPGGLVEDLWEQYRQVKLQEAQVGGLLNLILLQGDQAAFERGGLKEPAEGKSQRPRAVKIFDGGPTLSSTMTYVPLLERTKMKSLEEVNAQYRAGKGAERLAKLDAKRSLPEDAQGGHAI